MKNKIKNRKNLRGKRSAQNNLLNLKAKDKFLKDNTLMQDSLSYS